MLADDGKLSLQDPVAHYIDSAPVAWKYVTVSHLLRHTSGIKNMPEIADWDNTVRNDATPKEIVKAASALALDSPWASVPLQQHRVYAARGGDSKGQR